MANEKTPVVWDDTTKKHRPLGSGEKMGGLSASSMISTDSGNLLQQGSDGLMLVTGSSLADPRADNLLEESDSGKLQVTTDRVVEWLDGHPQAAAAIADAVKVVSEDSGNVIVQGADKGAYLAKGAISSAVSTMTDAQKNQLADAISPRIASDIADGQTLVASNGKLTFNPANATAAQKKAINQALSDPSSGLVVDNSTGKLGVDFSQMPTDKFEALLAGLKMQVPLSANLSLHVDTQSAAAGDTIIDGRGTAAKPFKTIQACVTWATGYYSLGRYSITVVVHPGVYDGRLNLPAYNTGGGSFQIKASDYSNPPILRVATGSVDTNISVSGGNWSLVRLNAYNRPVDSGGSANLYAYSLFVAENARVNVYGCEFDMAYNGAVSDRVRIYMVYADGTIIFNSMETYATKLTYHKGNADFLNVLCGGNGGKVLFSGGFDPSPVRVIECSGDADVFARATNQGLVSTIGGGYYRVYCAPASGATCTGKRYEATENSGIMAPGGNAFPGDVDGTVEAATYSWYKG